MVKSRLFIVVTLAEILLVALLFIYSHTVLRQGSWRSELEAKRELVGRLGLTDFAIWTEARYTRHPSQADFFSPFQDFPSSFEHFPAGSIIAPVIAVGGDTQ
jgi:hypothetical protein